MNEEQTIIKLNRIISRRFPITFDNDKPLPMQEDIDKSIQAYFKTRFDYRDLIIFLDWWTARPEYNQALATETGRYNPKGIRCGFVSKRTKQWALSKINKSPC